MRLLRRDYSGEYRLTEFLDIDIPPYAILSHTWEDEEVLFEDMINNTYKAKAGYKKLQFCAVQAALDDLEYFWVDTCCIDKTSSAELADSINSMFVYYERAVYCYVYLSDVPTGDLWGSPSALQMFRNSRWFTRGWTLQELLAPESVEFFSFDGRYLGSKITLKHELRAITGIRDEILLGASLVDVSVEERVSWLKGRQTSVEEDAVYSILGMFGVFMPLIYGEGVDRAFTRLHKEIEKRGVQRPNLNHDGLLAPGSRLSKATGFYNQGFKARDPGSDDGSETASSFSDGEFSMSSATTAGLNPVQTIGIHEVSRALLSSEDFKAVYTIAISTVVRRKARARMRSFLRTYGQSLLKEASNNILMVQAARFVQESADRIVDEITWNISGDTTDLLAKRSTPQKQNLESWLSSLQNSEGGHTIYEPNEVGVGSRDDDNYEQDESVGEPSDEFPFPNIDRVKEFLLASRAFEDHITTMRAWLKMDRKLEAPGPSVETHMGKDIAGIPTVAVTSHSPQNTTVSHKSQQETTYDQHLRQDPSDENKSSQIETNVDDIPQTAPHQPATRTQTRAHRSGIALITGLLNYWGISFFLYDLVEFIAPRVPQGYKRLHWRCSCNTVLWGDFSLADETAFDQLKREILCSEQPSAQRTHLGDVSTSQGVGDSNSQAHTAASVQHALTSRADSKSTGNSSTSTGTSSSLDLKNAVPSTRTDHVVNITFPLEHFEVCVSIGNHAIDHHEINISRVTSDGELFGLIWEKYNTSRGIGLRRIFLRPSNVDFVMFSVSRHIQYGAGIHKRPDEFPPQEELDKKRYHYLCPKIRMPANVFLHYLHRARWNIWGEHTETTWLRRLPKKLNGTICGNTSHVAQAGQPDPLIDPDLAFGWGIHIIDGPNHAVLGAILAAGVAVAFIVSGLVVGFAKTQEQGFGIGNFLLAILASIMAAIYFQLQD